MSIQAPPLSRFYRTSKTQGEFNAFAPAAPSEPATATESAPAGLSDVQVQAYIDARLAALNARKTSAAALTAAEREAAIDARLAINALKARATSSAHPATRPKRSPGRSMSREEFTAMRSKLSARANSLAAIFA